MLHDIWMQNDIVIFRIPLNLYHFFIHFPLELGGEGCYLSFFLQKCNFSLNKMTSSTSGKEHFKASLYFCYLGTASLQTHQDNLSSWISLPLHTIPFLLWQWKESLSIAHDVTDSYHFAILVFMMAEVWRSNTPLFFKKIWSNFTAGWRQQKKQTDTKQQWHNHHLSHPPSFNWAFTLFPALQLYFTTEE